jgi:glycosyltransferase involved in cell wall biosynthesis
MRVLLLNDGATPEGGAELQALRMRELLRESGHDVRLLASRASELGVASEADVSCFGSTRPKLRVVTQTANPSAAWALRRELARFPPDVVHIRMYLTQLSPLVLPLLRKVPTVWQVVYYKAICPRGTKVLPDGHRCTVRSGTVCLANRCVTPRSWPLAMAQQSLWRHWADSIDAVVTLSETMRERLAAEGIHGATIDDVRVLRNGVRLRSARPALGGRPTVAFAGRLVAEKGVDILLRAFAQITTTSPADARLLIAGDGPARSELQALADRLGVAEQTQFLGHLDREELERHFDRAWVQVVPGRWEEPLGNVTLEAMMRGTAVVASDIGGPAEVIDHGHTGLLVAAASVGSLTSALDELLIDRTRCEALGASGRAAAMEHYSEDLAVRRWECLYRELLASGKPRLRGAAR